MCLDGVEGWDTEKVSAVLSFLSFFFLYGLSSSSCLDLPFSPSIFSGHSRVFLGVTVPLVRGALLLCRAAV
ncbi:hypothetical protein B0I37DRAFT_376630 [Chaetomium sp. MPI-CAGE-AT-0009]|nr:hypothetical protein B0I37DRAFT_376630 [Chaetomium sp. MPI-CAGE-AT-0009]